MKPSRVREIRREAEQAWKDGKREYTLHTMTLLRLLDVTADTEKLRKLAGIAATYVGREPDTDVGVRQVTEMRRKLWQVWKGRELP